MPYFVEGRFTMSSSSLSNKAAINIKTRFLTIVPKD
jgi:hypothetical protein